jgi:4-amino-4-deoxy-L-arabinose transferase-like glycosyltransferase
VIALALHLLITEWRRRRWQAVADACRVAVPVPVIAAYYVLQKVVTGHFFVAYFDPFQPTLEAARAQLPFVTGSLFLMQGRWVCSLLIILALARARRGRREWLLFLLIFLGAGYSYSLLYFLPRYVLACAPYFFILAAWATMELVKSPGSRVVAGAALLAVSACHSLWPRITGNGEGNMGYLAVVAGAKDLCRTVETGFPGARVLARWPYAEYLRRPELGYVSRPAATETFARGRDAADADLVLATDRELRDLARERGLRRIRGSEAGAVRGELYGAPR